MRIPSVSEDFLLEAFELYVAKDEAEVLNICKQGEFDPYDEDLLDLVSSYKCFRSRTKENLSQIISQLVHQELIQKPKYISNCWKPIIASLKSQPELASLDAMKELYETKKPTTKKVVKLLNASPSNDSERNCLDNLKRYIKSLSDNSLSTFLQFITGSNLVTVKSILITFNTLDGVMRRPVAHTCGPTLEMPTTYQSYNELAEEFTSVITNKEAWSFTIV